MLYLLSYSHMNNDGVPGRISTDVNGFCRPVPLLSATGT